MATLYQPSWLSGQLLLPPHSETHFSLWGYTPASLPPVLWTQTCLGPQWVDGPSSRTFQSWKAPSYCGLLRDLSEKVPGKRFCFCFVLYF
jgi:hypothetical protein